MEDSFEFCPRCGARVPYDAAYCNECGTALKEYTPPGDNRIRAEDGLTMFTTFTLIYGIFVSLMGALILMVGFAITPDMWAQVVETVPDFETLYPGITEDTIQSMMLISGGITLAGGLCAIGSYVLMKRRTNHTVSMVLCAVASVLAFFTFGSLLGIICMAFGLYVTFRIYKNKNLFSS